MLPNSRNLPNSRPTAPRTRAGSRLYRNAGLAGVVVASIAVAFGAGAGSPLLIVYQAEWGFPDWQLTAAFTALRTDPLRESAHRLGVRIHLAEGNVDAALHQYSACRQVLDAELGVLPSAALIELVDPYLR